MSAVGRRHEDVADPLFIVALRSREADAHGNRPLVLPVLRRYIAAARRSHDILRGADVDARARQGASVQNYLELRNARVAIEAEIDDAPDLRERGNALLER